MSKKNTYGIVALGCSAGGLAALSYILERLPEDFNIPFIVVQHRAKDAAHLLLEKTLQDRCRIKVKQADEKEKIERGYIYIAPPDYHLLVEEDETFSLTVEKEQRYSRPSIDVLFETAAEIYGKRLTGILLTGASNDGADGIRTIRAYGGTTIAQDPTEALHPVMPQSAIDTGDVQQVLTLEKIVAYLIGLNHEYRTDRTGEHPAGG